MHLRTDALRQLRRWLPILVVLAAACSPDRYPQTALLPISDFARIGDDIQTQTFYWALGVFVLVEGALLYAIFRFRGKPDDPEPRQIHGNTTIEIIWTVIPGADPRGHRRAHGARHLPDRRDPDGRRCSRSRSSATSGGGSSAIRTSASPRPTSCTSRSGRRCRSG